MAAWDFASCHSLGVCFCLFTHKETCGACLWCKSHLFSNSHFSIRTPCILKFSTFPSIVTKWWAKPDTTTEGLNNAHSLWAPRNSQAQGVFLKKQFYEKQCGDRGNSKSSRLLHHSGPAVAFPACQQPWGHNRLPLSPSSPFPSCEPPPLHHCFCCSCLSVAFFWACHIRKPWERTGLAQLDTIIQPGLNCLRHLIAGHRWAY